MIKDFYKDYILLRNYRTFLKEKGLNKGAVLDYRATVNYINEKIAQGIIDSSEFEQNLRVWMKAGNKKVLFKLLSNTQLKHFNNFDKIVELFNSKSLSDKYTTITDINLDLPIKLHLIDKNLISEDNKIKRIEHTFVQVVDHMIPMIVENEEGISGRRKKPDPYPLLCYITLDLENCELIGRIATKTNIKYYAYEDSVTDVKVCNNLIEEFMDYYQIINDVTQEASIDLHKKFTKFFEEISKLPKEISSRMDCIIPDIKKFVEESYVKLEHVSSHDELPLKSKEIEGICDKVTNAMLISIVQNFSRADKKAISEANGAYVFKYNAIGANNSSINTINENEEAIQTNADHYSVEAAFDKKNNRNYINKEYVKWYKEDTYEYKTTMSFYNDEFIRIDFTQHVKEEDINNVLQRIREISLQSRE